MKIFVASSWRNAFQGNVVSFLRRNGYTVYDFKDSGYEFHWSEIDPAWREWEAEKVCEVIRENNLVEEAVSCDLTALSNADVVVGVYPFGVSAAMEIGLASGLQKPTVLVIGGSLEIKPETMLSLCNHICCSLEELKIAIACIESERAQCQKKEQLGENVPIVTDT
jgi:hypothetical protein